MRSILTVLAIAGLSVATASGADAKAGKRVYESSCKTCHGPDGAGNDTIANMMKVEMKDLKSTDVQSLSDAELARIITTGKGQMKPVSTVMGPSIDDVIAYVRTMKK